MATEAKRAPRVVRERTNMAVAAAALVSYYPGANADFVPAWVLLWEACGGKLVPQVGGRSLWFDPTDNEVSSFIGTVPVFLNGDERLGALKALAAMLRIAGPEASYAVFAYADGGEG